MDESGSRDFMAETNWEDDFDDIYNLDKNVPPCFSEVGGNIQGKFYQTYGGGPEGGYVIDYDNRVYQVSRNWNNKWEIKFIGGKLVERKVEWGMQIGHFEDEDDINDLITENKDEDFNIISIEDYKETVPDKETLIEELKNFIKDIEKSESLDSNFITKIYNSIKKLKQKSKI